MCEAHDRDGGGDVHDVGVGCIDEDDGEDGRRVVREAHVCRGLLNFWPPRQLVERASTIPHIVVLLVVLLLLQDGWHYSTHRCALAPARGNKAPTLQIQCRH